MPLAPSARVLKCLKLIEFGLVRKRGSRNTAKALQNDKRNLLLCLHSQCDDNPLHPATPTPPKDASVEVVAKHTSQQLFIARRAPSKTIHTRTRRHASDLHLLRFLPPLAGGRHLRAPWPEAGRRRPAQVCQRRDQCRDQSVALSAPPGRRCPANTALQRLQSVIRMSSSCRAAAASKIPVFRANGDTDCSGSMTMSWRCSS